MKSISKYTFSQNPDIPGIIKTTNSKELLKSKPKKLRDYY